MWSKKPTPVEIWARPVPSRSRLTLTFDSEVSRARFAVRALLMESPSRFRFEHGRQGVFEGLHLRRSARRYPQPAVRSGFPDQHPAVQQCLPHRVAVLEPPEEYEVGVGFSNLQPSAGEPTRQIVASLPQLVDLRQHLGRMGQGDPGGGLGQRRKVIGQPYDAERLDEGRSRRQIAEPPGGEGEGLGHRPAHREPRVVRKQLEGARSAIRANS